MVSKKRAKRKPAEPRPQTLGERLRLARSDSGLTQVQAAVAAGIHPQTLSRLETGRLRSTADENLRALASVYGVLFERLKPPPIDASA